MASWERLDHFLFSPAMLMWFPKLTQMGLPRALSDHHAIIVGEPNIDWGPSPFKVYNNWLEDKKLMGEALNGWKEFEVTSSKGFVLFSKVKAAKLRLKSWLSKVKREDNETDKLEDNLSKVEEKASVEGWSDGLRKERLRLLADL
ncbi:hypothetical protein Dsin_025204 [Dipteronia sinensis]|uniref:Uncharacterized protein n=1 Tax=Dipteronia sinensis TaxID=43782 RepID=A0AAE0DY50_9ROSI|nr:hypothetical protein Dsin_025204 [Dipteronia sinensis]